MSKSVDVLAELRGLAMFSPIAQQMLEAVAELIETAKDAQAQLRDVIEAGVGNELDKAALRRLNAAIASVQGESP